MKQSWNKLPMFITKFSNLTNLVYYFQVLLNCEILLKINIQIAILKILVVVHPVDRDSKD